MRRHRKQGNRRGFTLMEIILVTAILVIVASMATIGFVRMQKTATSKLVLNEIREMEHACVLYKLNNLKFPNSLNDLFNLPQGLNETQWGGPYLTNGDIYDPWGSEYSYTADDQRDQVIITSPGPDRTTNTEDDISNASTRGATT